MVAFAGRSWPQLGEDAPEAHRRRVTKLLHECGVETKAASALISLAPAPRNATTLTLLRGKHPSKDRDVIAACKATMSRGV